MLHTLRRPVLNQAQTAGSGYFNPDSGLNRRRNMTWVGTDGRAGLSSNLSGLLVISN